jgi:hypothetical protein
MVKDVHSAAVLALVTSLDTLKESEFPETLSLDFEKLSQLRNQFHFFVVSASMLDIVKNSIIKTNNPDDLRVRRLLQTRCGRELTPQRPRRPFRASWSSSRSPGRPPSWTFARQPPKKTKKSIPVHCFLALLRCQRSLSVHVRPSRPPSAVDPTNRLSLLQNCRW